MQAPKGRGGNAEISGTLPYDHTITQALLAMIDRTHEGADLLHMAVLEILDLICAKSDVRLLKHLVQRLIHEDPKVRETCLQAVKVVVNGKGLQFSGAAAAPRHKDVPGKYDATVEACSSFIADLTAQQRACGKLQNQALEVEIALQKPGADKVALKAELARLEEQIRNLKLPPDEAAVLAGRLQTVMDCMCSVVPAGNESAIGCVVSGIEKLHTTRSFFCALRINRLTFSSRLPASRTILSTFACAPSTICAQYLVQTTWLPWPIWWRCSPARTHIRDGQQAKA